MSNSEIQDEARRQNAQKSTGPKSEEGKKASSQNAIKHGLHATDIVINSPHLQEDQSLYDELVESLFNELKPKGVFQEHLAHKIAQCIWRHKRAINAEAATVYKQITPAEVTFEPTSEVGRYFQQLELAHKDEKYYSARSIPDGDRGLNLLRYEWKLERELYRSYRLLRILQLAEHTESPQNLLTGNDK